ncbi:aldo/keto reductase [Blastococcus sp. SYSU DS0533]
MGYGDSYADRAARDVVGRARELGITLFDTAEVYGFGRSERILGEALGDERDRVVVAGKILPVAPFPKVVRQRGAGSARRLGLDRIPSTRCTSPTRWYPTP